MTTQTTTKRQTLKEINQLGWLHGTQNIYSNPYAGTKKDAEFMAYHNGHNQGSWDKQFNRSYYKATIRQIK